VVQRSCVRRVTAFSHTRSRSSSKSRRERPVNVTRMREVLRGCDLRRFDSSRYVHLHIKLDVALSIFNGSALVYASCEVASL